MNTDTRLIPLTQGQFAIVDSCDYEWLNQWKWHAIRQRRQHGDVFYAMRAGRKHEKSNVMMHRSIAERAGFPESPEVDHADRNGLNNSRENLRPCSKNQNQANSLKRIGTASIYKGVTWSKRDKLWLAQITVNGKHLYLGCFKNEKEAFKTYAVAAMKYHGEFAFLDSKE